MTDASEDTEARRAEIAATFDCDLDPLATYAEQFQNATFDSNAPFQLFLDEVLATDNPRPGTYDAYERCFRQWREHMAQRGRHPACPNEQHVLAFIESELTERGNKPTTVKGKLRILSRVSKYWATDPAFPHPPEYNPFDIAREKATFEFRPLKEQHPIALPTIREHIHSVTHIRDQALLVVGFKLGARVTEVRNMRLEDISLTDITLQSQYSELGSQKEVANHQDAIYIPSRHERSGNKSMRPRVLPIDEELKRVLTRWLLARPTTGDPWVFLSKQRHDKLTKKAINKIWKEAFHPEFAETEAYRPVTSHYGRHYFCTYWRIEQNLNRERIKYMRGDSLDEDVDAGETIDHYLHTYYSDIEECYREHIYSLGV